MAKKALVVDDNRAMADSLCAMLRLLGLEPQAAYGPRGPVQTGKVSSRCDPCWICTCRASKDMMCSFTCDGTRV